MPPSKSQADKAGALLREWWGGSRRDLEVGGRAAVDVVWAYRVQFQYPLTRVNANLRHYVKGAGCEVFIAQRLKRLPRIIEKLHRHPRMRLSQMQDVGGCRAILPDKAAIDSVLAGIRRNWEVITVDDYIAEPKPDGYRAIHVIVRRGGVPIEVQLRTFGQQDWADEVERIDGRVDYAVKDGEGPAHVLRYLWLLAEVIATSEAGHQGDEERLREMAELRRSMP